MKFTKKKEKLYKKKSKKKINIKIKSLKGGEVDCSIENKIKVIVCHGYISVDNEGITIPESCNIITTVNQGKFLMISSNFYEDLEKYLKTIDYDINRMFNLKSEIQKNSGKKFNKENYSDETSLFLDNINSNVSLLLDEQNKIYQDDIEGFKETTYETELYYGQNLNVGEVNFLARIGDGKMTMNNLNIDFSESDESDINGLFCYDNNPENHELNGIYELNFRKKKYNLLEFLKIFNNTGTFLFFCCRNFDSSQNVSSDNLEVVRNLSNLPVSLDLRQTKFTNCVICNKITYYKLDKNGNDPDKFNECEECKSLDEESRVKKKRFKEKQQNTQLKIDYKEYLEKLFADLSKEFLKFSNTLKKKKLKTEEHELRNKKIIDICKKNKIIIDRKFLEITEEHYKLDIGPDKLQQEFVKAHKVENKIISLRKSLRTFNNKLLKIR